jgi:hypothetical protein
MRLVVSGAWLHKTPLVLRRAHAALIYLLSGKIAHFPNDFEWGMSRICEGLVFAIK